MSKQTRNEQDRAPGYDELLINMRLNSPVLNPIGVRKSPGIDAFSDTVSLQSKWGKLGYLNGLTQTAEDDADAGQIQRAETALTNAMKPLEKINADRQIKGKDPLNPADMPKDNRAENLAYAQARYDVLIEERDQLRKELLKIEAAEAEYKQQEKERKQYAGEIQGFHENDPQLPRAIDGRPVSRDKKGTAIFTDTNEKVAPYLAECERRRQEREANAREAQKVIQQRGDLERHKVPRGVLQGNKPIHEWLQEQQISNGA